MSNKKTLSKHKAEFIKIAKELPVNYLTHGAGKELQLIPKHRKVTGEQLREADITEVKGRPVKDDVSYLATDDKDPWVRVDHLSRLHKAFLKGGWDEVTLYIEKAHRIYKDQMLMRNKKGKA